MSQVRVSRMSSLLCTAALLLAAPSLLPARTDPPAPAARAVAPAPEHPPPSTGPVVAVDATAVAEPDIEARLVGPRAELDAEMQRVVGRAARALGKHDGLLGSLVADVMREHAAQITGQPVDVAFTNVGGLRATFAPGPITRGAVMAVLPFENTLVVFELKGVDLQAVLDRSAMHNGDPISGAEYSVQDRKAVDARVGGQPLDPARVYRVCTTDFIVDGGGRFEGLKRAARINRTGVLLRDALMQHLEELERAGKPLDVSGGARVKVLDSAPAPDSTASSHGSTP